MKHVLCCALMALFLAGCATLTPNFEFVRSINFTPLDTFEYRHTLVSGMDFKSAHEHILKQSSQAVLVEELKERGFEAADEAADFYVVTKWRKGMSVDPNHFDPLYGTDDLFSQQRDRELLYRQQIDLTLEIYEGASGDLFWCADFPNVFELLQLNEAQVQVALERAIQNFPQRVEKDPSLPSID
jgi:hypothetical protein